MSRLSLKAVAVLSALFAVLGLTLAATPASAVGGAGMQIYISMPGTSEHVRLDVEGSDSILNVKQKIQDVKHILPETFFLYSQGRVLPADHVLDELNILPEQTLHLFFNAGAPAWQGGTPVITCGQYLSRSIASTGTGVQYGVVAGSLPAGLSLNGLNGVISGTPTTAGHYSFTISANNEGSSARTVFRGNVVCGLPDTGRSDAQPALLFALALLALGVAAVTAVARSRQSRP